MDRGVNVFKKVRVFGNIVVDVCPFSEHSFKVDVFLMGAGPGLGAD